MLERTFVTENMHENISHLDAESGCANCFPRNSLDMS